MSLRSLPLSARGLPTGIGSLPFTDPHEALALIRGYFPEIPHWPQLPLRGSVEGLEHQFLQILIDIGILVTRDRAQTYFNTSLPDWTERLTEFYSIWMEADEGHRGAMERFGVSRISAPGFHAFLDEIRKTGPRGMEYVKGHLVGPLTAGFQLKDERGRLAYYQDGLRDLIVKALAMHARWQAVALADLDRPVILFVDDPCIGACGSCYHITLTREMILEDLNAIFDAAHKGGAFMGLHSCNAVDWSLLFESDLEIVSLDAYRFGDSLICHAPRMESFLERGGMVAWGIVPTQESALTEDAGSLLERLKTLWQRLIACGVDSGRLRAQSLFTPACGTGLLSPGLARRIYGLTADVAALLRRETRP